MKNTYKCSPAIWKKFKDIGKWTFNEVMSATKDQRNYKHTKSPLLPKKEWFVLRHNIACEAAWIAENSTYGFM